MRRRHWQASGDLSHIQTLNELDPCHLSELREFHMLGKNIASRLRDFHDSRTSTPITMKLGYHAIPSLEPLHLHIISADMDSPYVTTRKHIVSFSSPLFFIDPELVERHLESAFADSIRLSIQKERAQNVLDSAPMVCTRCKREAISVPDWKRHNQGCTILPISISDDANKMNSLLGWTNTGLSKIIQSKRAGLTQSSKKRKQRQLDEARKDTYHC
mmetsp:Transcript_24675/g.59494  ORF Transcript_24675/g.59494 Transcript_24675/m.59494 type:complete len:216 (+) Transcript_24675:537-1184(+)